MRAEGEQKERLEGGIEGWERGRRGWREMGWEERDERSRREAWERGKRGVGGSEAARIQRLRCCSWVVY